MATRDPAKRRATKRRYLAKKQGIPVDQLPVGRGNNPRSWGNHREGPEHPRWSDERMVSAEGYTKVRVGKEHPLADPNGYAYEHLVVWVAAGRPKPAKGSLLHHKNETKSDNRLSNLELKRKDRHGIDHASSLSDADMLAIRLAYDAREANTIHLAERYGVPAQSIWKLIRGKTRLAAGGPIQTGRLHNRPNRVLHDAMPVIS